MPLRVYNTITRQKEDFVPLRGRRVTMFVCGLTPYDHSHLGHAKTYVAFDVVARYLRHKGYSVFYVQNVTDIDDHIVDAMKERSLPWQDVIRPYWEEYVRAMEQLNVTSVNLFARATDYAPEIVEQVQGLIAKGHAYAVGGDVYYAVDSFDGWGKLSGQKTEELLPGARVEVDARKRNPADFALWKSQKPGEPAWDSPWGKGRPGWHIEDTAITISHFGSRYDIHGGATELMFPHHEAEIAQAEAFTGERPFVKYWMHTGLLNVKGEKMSKSLGNFWSMRDALAQYDGEVLRFFLVYAHYRSPIDYSREALEEAKAAYGRLTQTIQNLEAQMRSAPTEGTGDGPLRTAANVALEAFEAAMDDDFNTREALAAVFDFANAVNRALGHAGKGALAEGAAAFETFGQIIGLWRQRQAGPEGLAESLVGALVELREDARSRKDFALSDRIRDLLAVRGILLEDTKTGVRWKVP